MADYPDDLPQMEGTRANVRHGVKSRYASNGDVRLRDIQGSTRADPIVVHRNLTAAEYGSFMTFYDDNRAGVFDFTYHHDESTVSCAFGDKPYDVDVAIGLGGAKFYNLTVYLVQVV